MANNDHALSPSLPPSPPKSSRPSLKVSSAKIVILQHKIKNPSWETKRKESCCERDFM